MKRNRTTIARREGLRPPSSAPTSGPAAPAPAPAAAAAVSGPAAAFGADVRRGLGDVPKHLPCKYLYDEIGSALFEAITLLPEYGVTRAEEALLQAQAMCIAERLVPGLVVTELGSGGGKKTATLLQALLSFQPGITYHPIDISPAALDSCQLRMASMPGVHVRAVEGLYLEGLRRLSVSRPEWPPMLVLFLGSNIGNFDPPEARGFLSEVRGCLREGDAVLVGADLRKPEDRLLAAYDDPTGVTAAFNLNLLARINRELDGRFDLRAFEHEARWCGGQSRVEMHLRSLVDQQVPIAGCGIRVSFEAGETIWTESSYKYDLATLDSLARSAGFELEARWVEPEWGFAECLWKVG